MAINESRLGLLWKRYLSDELTPDEWNELAEILESTDEGKQFFVTHSEEARLFVHLSYMHQMNDEKIRRRIEQMKRESSAPPRMWIYLAAACLAGMIFTAGWLFYGQKPKAPTAVTTKASTPADIPPGGNAATLTLGNGQRIDLDAAKQGLIAEEGSKVSKVAAGQLVYASNAEAKPTMNTIATQHGTYQIKLPDGTEVTLDAESSISFPSAFTGASREIEVTGQVFVEAAKDKHQPFRVKMNDGTFVNVLGTRFNIDAYSKNIQVTLVDGAVQVGKDEERVTLHPGQAATVENNNLKVLYHPDIDQTLAWKSGWFQWQSADIETVMSDLSRWYAIDVKFEGEKSASHFNAHVSRSSMLSDVLEILRSAGYRFRVEGQTVTVLP